MVYCGGRYIKRESIRESMRQVRECVGGVIEREVCLWVVRVFEIEREGGDARG